MGGWQVERYAVEARSAVEDAESLQQELEAERAAREATERELAELRVLLHKACHLQCCVIQVGV